MKTIYVFEKCYKDLQKYGKSLVLWNKKTSNNMRSENRYGIVNDGDNVNVRYCRKGGIESILGKVSSVNFDGKFASATVTKIDKKDMNDFKNEKSFWGSLLFVLAHASEFNMEITAKNK